MKFRDSTVVRTVATLATLILWDWLSKLYAISMQLKLGQIATDQLHPSDGAAIEFSMMETFFNNGKLHAGVLVAILLVIWWTAIKRWTANKPKTGGGTALALLIGLSSMLCYAPDASAYYEKTDRAEWAEIGANQSAFLMPVLGNNKDKQVQFGSIEYLAKNKVGAKRVQIPHAKADNTSAVFDYYVPTHKLFLLDRTPFTREWTKSAAKGTSVKNEGFRFESADSLSIETAITVSALVTEEDAAKFFYWFGTANTQPSTDPQVVFNSISYGRSLANVMDDVVRSRVQTVLAKEFGKRKLIVGISEKAAIIDIVEKIVKEEFAVKGITILFLGYADELTLDEKVQHVLNDTFIVQAKFANKDAYEAVLALDKRQADINFTNSTAAAVQKWNGVITLPSFLIASDNFFNSIMSWFKGFGGTDGGKK